ncbi:putative aspartic proteinase GIP2 [Bidens hawaiensis]|uniref:putative aspartic proteinase GIP2 n=1 Tax=Bidens hawaiensis TaxID=980011 RepID=UPI00404B51C2
MYLLLQLLVIVLAFISLEHVAIIAHAQPYTSIVAPINKHTDVAKPLYSVKITTTLAPANFLIDIDAPFIWYNCIVQWNRYLTDCPSNTVCTTPVSYVAYQCEDVRTYTYSYKNPSCSGVLDWGFTCPIHVVEPVTSSCDQVILNYDHFTLYTSDGRMVGVNPNAACATPSLFTSFPANVSGVMAFSSSPYTLPAYFSQQTLALCIPSKSSTRGVLFFGNGPYYLLPQSKVDIRSYLSYTPLLKHQNSFGYFISVNSIVIKNRSINVPTNTTTKLSTIDPYTTLRTDIYNGVVRRFSMVTKRLHPAKPVAPFGLCFSTSTIGLKVPNIDFILPDGKKWTVSTANSIKKITKKVACLAFVDGGATSEPAIVIGAFQFEDNFLEFNLQNSTLGFSSSLLRKKTSCANLNFTPTNNP